MEKCKCKWVANSGNGGKPVFKPMFGSVVMHVKCSKCNTRTWLTEDQWDAL